MAGLRSNRALNRNNRSAVDHDIMEGLPVRQWRKQNVVVSTQPPKEDAPANNDPHNRWRELPMPRGSEQYSPWSQALLRAARRPHMPQRFSKTQDEDKDLAEEAKPAPEPDAGIETVKWAQISRDQEQPEIEFLAKRRKGLPSLLSDTATAQPMRMVKVKKVDAEGNVSVFDVLRPEGTVLEGEIVKDEEIPTEAPAPGTVVEGVGVANEQGVLVAVEPAVATPHRRGPPRGKRKMKGPGRGRKKKQFLSPAVAAAASAETATQLPSGVESSGGTLQVPGVSADGASGTDVDMGEESAAKDGDEGSDDEDDDGDDREEGDRSDAEGPTRSVSPMRPSAEPKTGAAPATAEPALKPEENGGTNISATDAKAHTAQTVPIASADMPETASGADPPKMDEASEPATDAMEISADAAATTAQATSDPPDTALPIEPTVTAPPPEEAPADPTSPPAAPTITTLLNPTDIPPASTSNPVPAEEPAAALSAPAETTLSSPATAQPEPVPPSDTVMADYDAGGTALPPPQPQPVEPVVSDASAAPAPSDVVAPELDTAGEEPAGPEKATGPEEPADHDMGGT